MSVIDGLDHERRLYANPLAIHSSSGFRREVNSLSRAVRTFVRDIRLHEEVRFREHTHNTGLHQVSRAFESLANDVDRDWQFSGHAGIVLPWMIAHAARNQRCLQRHRLSTSEDGGVEVGLLGFNTGRGHRRARIFEVHRAQGGTAWAPC